MYRSILTGYIGLAVSCSRPADTVKTDTQQQQQRQPDLLRLRRGPVNRQAPLFDAAAPTFAKRTKAATASLSNKPSTTVGHAPQQTSSSEHASSRTCYTRTRTHAKPHQQL